MNFDEHGKITRVTDRSSFYANYTYESVSPGDEDRARLISIVDRTGMQTSFEYASTDLEDRQPIRIKKHGRSGATRVTHLSYDPVEDWLTSITLPNGDKTEFFYHSNGKLRRVVEPGGRVPLEYTFYPDDKVHTETQYGIQKRTYSYDAVNRSVTVTTIDEQTSAPDIPSPSRSTTYYYDFLYNTVEIVDSIGKSTSMSYKDPRNPHLVTSVVAPNLSTTSYKYNSRGNVTEQTDARDVTTKFQYAEDIGPSGIQYLDLLRKVIEPAAGTTPETETEMVYTGRGELSQVIDDEGNSAKVFYKLTGAGYQIDYTENRLLNKTTFSYDGNGRVTGVAVETGRTTGDITSSVGYDQFDNVTSAVAGSNVITNTMGYDSLDRLTSSTLASLGITSTMDYQNGLLEKIIAPSNQASAGSVRENVFSHDSAGRVTGMSRSFGSQTTLLNRVQYGFDGFSQLRKLSRTENGQARDYEYTYDSLGRLLNAKDPKSALSYMQYEPYCTGNASTSARGKRIRTTMDTLCRPTQIQAGDAGQEAMEVDNATELRQFEYDDRGRLTKTLQGASFNFGEATYGVARYGEPNVTGDGGVRSYKYDNLDRLEKIILEDETYISYTYDKVGNVKTISENSTFGSTSTAVNVTEFDYHKDNLLDEVRLVRSGIVVATFSYTYDSIGRVETMVYPAATNLVAHFTWDDAGRLTQLTYKKNGVNQRDFVYEYDKSGNRTQTIETAGSTTLVQQYEYDWLDRLLFVKEGSTTLNTQTKTGYMYDDVDNIVSIDLPLDDLLYEFTHDAADNVLSRTKTDTETTPSLLFTETFVPDADGNILTRTRDDTGVEISYEWDDFGKLMAVASSISGTPTNDAKQENLYGVSGLRRRKTKKSGEVVTEYAEGLNTAVSKSLSDTFTYLRVPSLMGFETNGSFYYFLTDALGSVRDIVRGTDGVAVQAYSFNERGQQPTGSGTGSVDSRKTFVGGMSVNDDTGDSGLFLMGHRHYDPTLGRFLSRDPIGMVLPIRWTEDRQFIIRLGDLLQGFRCSVPGGVRRYESGASLAGSMSTSRLLSLDVDFLRSSISK